MSIKKPDKPTIAILEGCGIIEGNLIRSAKFNRIARVLPSEEWIDVYGAVVVAQDEDGENVYGLFTDDFAEVIERNAL